MRHARIAVCGLLICLTAAAFAPVLSNGFLQYDDGTYVERNPNIQHGLSVSTVAWAFTTTRAANWHPLTWLSHALDWSLYGASPRGHHLSSLVLHAANVVLLFLLLDRMTGALFPSALTAALFAVHPLHVESVAWIAERKDVLSTLFWLLSTWAYVAYAEAPGKGRLVRVVVLMAVGLLAKPMLVTLPLTFLLLDAWPLERTDLGWRSLLVEKLPLFALSAAAGVTTFFAQRAGGAVASLSRFPLEDRVANAIRSYAAYLGKTVWPRGLAAFYPHPTALSAAAVALAAAMLIAVTAIAVKVRRRHPYVLTGWLWYVVTLLPVIGIVQVGNQGMADRYTYVPLIGIFVGVSWTVAALTAKAPMRGAIPAVAIVLALGALTHAQAAVWHDSVTLFESALASTPRNATALINLGAGLEARGKKSEAMSRYEEALRLDSENRVAHNRIAGLLAAQGRLDEAAGHYQNVLRGNPKDPETLNNLGIALA